MSTVKPGEQEVSNHSFGGFRSIDVSNQLFDVSSFVASKEQRKIDSILKNLARALARNMTVTHINIQGIKFSGPIILEVMKAISNNYVLQELKMDVTEYRMGKGKDEQSLNNTLWQLKTKIGYKQRLSSQYNLFIDTK